MEKIRQRIRSEFDGLELGLEYIVPTETRGIVQFSHGMAEHKERYEPFMEYLAKQGFLCAIHDHRGHGESVKSTEDLGYFYSEDIRGVVEDLHQVTLFLKEKYPNLPVYLFSHSMGTLVARNYMKTYDYELEKIILCGPPTQNPLVGLALGLTKLVRKMKGGKHRNTLVNFLAFQGYNKEKGQENSWLSSDENEVRKYNQNPLCGFTFTNNGFINLFTLLEKAFSEEGWQKRFLDLPVFVVGGKEDPVIQGEKKFDHLLCFLKGLGYSNVKGKLYEGMRHELLNERNRETVYEDVLRFLEE